MVDFAGSHACVGRRPEARMSGDRAVITVLGWDGSPLAAAGARRAGLAPRRWWSAVPGTWPRSRCRRRPGADDPSARLERGPAELDARAAHRARRRARLRRPRLLRHRPGAARAPGSTLVVLPAVSSVALAFARVGLPWDDALVVSTHGRDPRPGGQRVPRAPQGRGAHRARRRPGRAGRGAGRQGPPCSCVAALGTDRGDWLRRASARGGGAAGPGRDAERRAVASRPAAAARPTVAGRWRRWVARAARADAGAVGAARARVRAPRLDGHQGRGAGAGARPARPRARALVWDVGAGQRLGGSRVRPVRRGRGRRRAGRGGLRTHPGQRRARTAWTCPSCAGEAPAALADLPDPDAVFVGGGGLRRPRGRGGPAARRGRGGPRRAGPGRSRRGPRSARPAIPREGVAAPAARLADLPGDVTRLAATNPVFVVWASRPADHATGRQPARDRPRRRHRRRPAGRRPLAARVAGHPPLRRCGRHALRPGLGRVRRAGRASSPPGATVRLLAPLLADKATDPAVVCVDEARPVRDRAARRARRRRQRPAERVADAARRPAVITTATDAPALPGARHPRLARGGRGRRGDPRPARRRAGPPRRRRDLAAAAAARSPRRPRAECRLRGHRPDRAARRPDRGAPAAVAGRRASARAGASPPRRCSALRRRRAGRGRARAASSVRGSPPSTPRPTRRASCAAAARAAGRW